MADAIDPAIISCYHAHIYYDDASRGTAARIREEIERKFKVEMGRWRDALTMSRTPCLYLIATPCGGIAIGPRRRSGIVMRHLG